MRKSIIAGSLVAAVLPGLIMAAMTTYKTRSGDTLQSVAQKYGMTVQDFAAANPSAKLVSNQNVSVNAPTPTPTPTPTPVPTGEVRFQAYITGYSWYDNTPPGSADICCGVIHSKAGGVGTYDDPITMAVGHVITNGKSTLDYPAGTRFYLPYLKRYFIVEDACGDGSKPQNGPCHTGYPKTAKAWLDVYVGKGPSKSASNTCMNNLTDVHLVIQNPASTYPVVSGEIAQNCALYADSI